MAWLSGVAPTQAHPPLLPCTAGTRALGVALLTSCHMFPPLPSLLLHAVHSRLTFTPYYCSTPLLSAPLARQRQAGLARALELASLPLAAYQPIAGHLAAKFEGE